MTRNNKGARTIAGWYALFGVLWIVISDRVVEFFVQDRATLTQLQTYKGWLFIFVTAALIYYLARRALNKQHDLTDTLEKSEARLQFLVTASPAVSYTIEPSGNHRTTYMSDNVAEQLGYTPAQFIENPGFWCEQIHPDDRESVMNALKRLLKTGANESEYRFRHANGTYHWMHDAARIIRDSDANPISIVGYWIDVSERKRAEDDRAKMEQELLQAQKMEAIGRLAGGVAHDFNNMLGVILGYSDSALASLNPSDPLYQDIQQILRAGQRSADLTRQLLAFARKETIAPQVLDLNTQIGRTEKLLRRLVGEDIRLRFVPGAALWDVHMDPSQVDQILANLAVNARDAITGTGSMVIETSNVRLTAEQCEAHPDAKPGEYVCLSFSDSGCGMDKETMARIFEPFFTTKGIGKGTGLGLATVFGVIQQNRGFIMADSTLGKGTTFTIYIPRHRGQRHEADAVPVERPLPGNETILVVEDEEQILQLCKESLERYGYTVIAASTPTLAIRAASEFSGHIRLLLTDVVMPEMNGKELSERIAEVAPEVRVVYMSGYTAGVIGNTGVIPEGTWFLQKPFTPTELVAKVRETLDRH